MYYIIYIILYILYYIYYIIYILYYIYYIIYILYINILYILYILYIYYIYYILYILYIIYYIYIYIGIQMDIPWYNQQDDFGMCLMGFLLPVMAIWMGMIRWWLSSGFFGVYPYFQTNPIGCKHVSYMWKYLLDEPPLVESEKDITGYGRSRLSPLITGAHSLANWDQRSDNNNYDSKYSVGSV